MAIFVVTQFFIIKLYWCGILIWHIDMTCSNKTELCVNNFIQIFPLFSLSKFYSASLYTLCRCLFERPFLPSPQGYRYFCCPTPQFLSVNLSNKACMLYFWNCDIRGVIFGLRCTIFNISWTMCTLFIWQSV
jgi:hypothetical protein